METGGDGIDLSQERRVRGVYYKRCKQILDILHNRGRKPSPTLFDKSVLELHEHLTKEHSIGDDMRRARGCKICDVYVSSY